MNDDKTLENFRPKELDEIKQRIKNLEDGLSPVIDHVSKLTERLNAAQELFDKVYADVEAIREGASYNEIARAIRELTARIQSSESLRGTEVSPTLGLSSLPNIDLLDIDQSGSPIIVKPKKFLGDQWGPVNDAIRTLGGNWIRDKENSRWEIGGVASPTPQPQKDKLTIKNPNDPASTKQVAWLEKQGIIVKDGLTKGEASKLIDRRMKEIDAKKKT